MVGALVDRPRARRRVRPDDRAPHRRRARRSRSTARRSRGCRRGSTAARSGPRSRRSAPARARSRSAAPHWFAQLVPVPGYQGEHQVEYLLLRSIDEALAPARRIDPDPAPPARRGRARDACSSRSRLARRLSRPIDALVARTQAIARRRPRGASDRRARPRSARSAPRWIGWRSELDESRTAARRQGAARARARDRGADPDLDPAAQPRRRRASRSRRG